MVTELSSSKLAKLLEGITSKDGKHNLLNHLNKMYEVKAVLDDEKKFNDLFEDISIRIKKNGKYPAQPEKPAPVKVNPKEKELLKPLVKAEGEGEATPVSQVNFVPDYLEIFQKLSWAGISFGEKKSLFLTNSLRNLSSNLPNGNVTFFGKITGTEKDYYIAEATEVDPPADFNYENDMERRKEDGVNRNTFYVTNDLSEKWVELPDVKPAQVNASRMIRYRFTGDLNRQIYSNPYFYGQEKHYLRCQLARIYHGTKLVPSINHYTIEDPESPFKAFTPAEKPQPLTNEHLTNMKYWIHYPPGILKCGRVSHIIDEAPEGVDPEEYKKKIMDKDPFDKRIKSVLEDTKIISKFKSDYNSIEPWRLDEYFEDKIYVNPYVKLLDETQPDFDPLEQKDNKSNYTMVIVRSLRWPGAINVYMGKEVYFFYFGDGLKYLDEINEGTFSFNSFPKIPDEAPEREDQPEPTVPKAQVNPEEEKKEEDK